MRSTTCHMLCAVAWPWFILILFVFFFNFFGWCISLLFRVSLLSMFTSMFVF